jgi:hypothetical protein
MQPDFIPISELAKLTCFEPKTLYNQHSTGAGPLAAILVRLGGRLGVWRADYELWRDAQRRLKPASEQRPAA